MKILFICRSNAGRSQAAEAFLNFMPEHKAKASSAGTDVEKEGGTGLPAASTVAEVLLQDYGIDISNAKRKQVTEKMLQEHDKVIVLMENDEAEKVLPAYFKRFAGKITFWDVPDMRGVPIIDERLKERIHDINVRVKGLIQTK